MTDQASASLAKLKTEAKARLSGVGSVYLYRSQAERDHAQADVDYHQAVIALIDRTLKVGRKK
jgi:hypothetical protein